MSQSAGLEVTHLHWPESGQQPNIDDAIRNKELQMVFMFSNQLSVRSCETRHIYKSGCGRSV
jgi:hypothetical protein